MSTRAEALALQIAPGSSSLFSHPRAELDPRLFAGNQLRQEVRVEVLRALDSFLAALHKAPERWMTAYLAGSAASYQWHHSGGLADFDILLSVDFSAFRQANPEYAAFSDDQLAQRLNSEFYNGFNPQLKGWRGFEVTAYVNPGAGQSIRAIHPYAAYDLTHDHWTVSPPMLPPDWNPRVFFPQHWWSSINTEISQVQRRLADYERARQAGNHDTLAQLVPELVGYYNDIHTGRKNAFGPNGLGYADYYNLRWQAHKAAGTEQALRTLHDYYSA